MAIKLSKYNNHKRRRHMSLTSEINVTPLVDVMLVLLIIFMVTSPMLVAGVNVDLPETKSSPISGQDEPLVISINKEGELFLFETKISRSELKGKLLEVTKEKKDSRIFVRGDKNIAYGEVVSLMAEIYSAGFTKVALISNIKHNEK